MVLPDVRKDDASLNMAHSAIDDEEHESPPLMLGPKPIDASRSLHDV